MEPIYINGVCTKYVIDRSGLIMNLKTNRFIKSHLDRCGYYRVILYINKKQKNLFVHQLVAITFLDNPKKLNIVNHLDNDRTNNHVNNLEWSTSKLNNDYKVMQNRHVKGEQIQTAKLTVEQVLNIRYNHQFGMSNREIASKYGVDIKVIWRIIKRETWKHI